jgi:putative ABC transport system ATP-binding protein
MPVTAAASPLIARDVSLRVADRHSATVALRGVSLELPAGELTAVVGPEGSGKSSLLHLLAGLDRPTGGSIVLAGRTLGTLAPREQTGLRRRHIGLLLPEAPALPTISVRENVALPLMIACERPAPEAIDALLRRVGIAQRRDLRPGDLTASERRRAALARALLGHPSVILADEPARDLDAAESAAMLALLRNVAHEDGIAVAVFTRDDAVAAVADRVVRLDAGRVAGVAEPIAA